MGDTTYALLALFSPLVQKLVIAWVFAAVTNSDAGTIGLAFAVLIGIRLIFYLGSAIFKMVAFGLYRKRFVVRKMLDDLRRLQFPMREDPDEDWLTYLTRTQKTESLPFSVRRAAAFMEGQMDLHSKSGLLLRVESESVMKAALSAWTRRASS